MTDWSYDYAEPRVCAHCRSPGVEAVKPKKHRVRKLTADKAQAIQRKADMLQSPGMLADYERAHEYQRVETRRPAREAKP
jgi:hypothetical protein